MTDVTGSDRGVQPLDALMTALGLKNSDLVAVSEEQLTHKVVQKGRRGRQLTRNAQMKILKAFEKAAGRKAALEELFTYKGKE